MKISQLKEFHHRQPFQSFVLIMDNGQKLPVPHPDHLFFSPKNRDNVVVARLDGTFSVLDLEHISSLELQKTKPG